MINSGRNGACSIVQFNTISELNESESRNGGFSRFFDRNRKKCSDSQSEGRTEKRQMPENSSDCNAGVGYMVCPTGHPAKSTVCPEIRQRSHDASGWGAAG